MRISFDYNGCYREHKEYFDIMANALQKAGHEVGMLTGLREKEYDYNNNLRDNKKDMIDNLGFKPDFAIVWGENETISNGALWIAQKIMSENIQVHYDDDATEIKKYTDRWIIKTMNNGEMDKF